MPKLENYKGGIPMTGGFTPKGAGDFPLMEAHDIVVDETGTRLDDKLENLGGSVYSLQPISATSANGQYYFATVPGVKKLDAGLNLIIIPDFTSSVVNPYLNVNSLGSLPLRRRGGVTTGINETGGHTAWLTKGMPISVMYTGTYWVVVDMKRPVAADLYGYLPISLGGTGATTAANALTKLGAASAGHTHDLADLGGYNDVATVDDLREVYDATLTNASNISNLESRMTALGFKEGTLGTVIGSAMGAYASRNKIFKIGKIAYGYLTISYDKYKNYSTGAVQGYSPLYEADNIISIPTAWMPKTLTYVDAYLVLKPTGTVHSGAYDYVPCTLLFNSANGYVSISSFGKYTSHFVLGNYVDVVSICACFWYELA